MKISVACLRPVGLVTTAHIIVFCPLRINRVSGLIHAALLLLAAAARGQPLVYEPFNYPAGQLLTGQSNAAGQGWINGGSGVDDASIVAGNISIPGLAAPRGNSLTNGGAGPGNRILFNTTLGSGTVYYSFALRVDKLGSSFAGGTSFIASLGCDSAGTLVQEAQLYVRTNSTGTGGHVLGITKTDGSAIVFTSQVFTNSETLFIVASYTFVTGNSTDDVVKLWLNPDPLTFGAAAPPPATLTATVVGTDIAQIDRLNLRQNIASKIPEAMMIDELRVATNWAGVTPVGGIGPPLTLVPLAGGFSLRWPVARRGFLPETSATLGDAAQWSVLTNNIAATGTNYSLALNPTAGEQYFRLRQLTWPGWQVESVHYAFDVTEPGLTDALRLSDRTGVNFWALSTSKASPETGVAVPYAYSDGYVEWIGEAGHVVDTSPAGAALRWYKIKNGQGDIWTGASAAAVGYPAVITLDEVTTNFKDTLQGPALQEALRIYLTQYGGSRDDIIAFLQRSASLTATPGLYSHLIFCVNNYLRGLALEVYCSQQGFVTGVDADGNNIGLTGDSYLTTRLALPFKRWADAGVSPVRLFPVVASGNFGGYPGYVKPFNKFLNRQMWFLANGWYNSTHTGVDPNVQLALRNGVGAYKWQVGTTVWQLVNTEANRDAYFEKYVRWYCVDGHLDAHPDGVDAN